MTIHIHPFEEESPYPHRDDGHPLEQIKTNPTKRLRWATHRASKKEGIKKRQSILDRLHHKRASTDKTENAESDSSLAGNVEPAESSVIPGSRRTIYFNRPLPDSARYPDGHPIVHYARNKIRTAKYTPISFVPKNLYFQFHNIANMYFLFIIILSIFPIFGASNPGLNAVPLIVILFVTAVKDAIEDFRRRTLDNELNNSPVHRLLDWNNVNTAEDKVSLWRKFKKANTRAATFVFHTIGRLHKKDPKKKGALESYAERALDFQRPSYDTPRSSMSRIDSRSVYSEHQQDNKNYELAAVASPRASHDPTNSAYHTARNSIQYDDTRTLQDTNHLKVPTGDRNEKSVKPSPPKRFYGSFIDPEKNAEGKARFKKDFWKNVQVGDFVRLYNEEQIPADVVVLSTSDPDGACYVETKNLDGETNLKVRQALHAGRKIKRAKDCEKTDFWIESEPAHPNLYAYSGTARWLQKDPTKPSASATEMVEPININNVLLRGCSVRNTDWVLGVVIFTGEDTKIMLNSGLTPSKRARISRDLNWNVIYNFIILFLMCLVAGIVEGTFWGKPDTSIQFFEYGSYGGTPAVNGVITFWAAIILFQNLVPISLYISLEIIRTIQAYFIYSDAAMYYAKLDYPCTPKSWNISDDLGQIEYIFSDKTGTLTQNVMEFKKVTINGVAYGEAYTEAQAGMQKRMGIDTEIEGARMREKIGRDRVTMLQELRAIHNNPYLRDEEVTFVSSDFVADLRGASGDGQRVATEQFMLALALCHTVITEKTPGNPPKMEFKAQSPDEAALVATARDCGFTVIGRSNDGLILNIMGLEQEFTVLNILEFNSSRKRMSAIVRMPDGKIILFCKGADSVIYSRLRAGQQKELRQRTAEDLEEFAREGLRTLCIAQKELREEDYQAWSIEHDAAAAAVEGRDEKLEVVSDAIERDLMLLGGTAIEDRLQDGVPDAIALLGNAGIKLWVLTGDKVETAINIGFSCNLLNNDMELLLFKLENDSIDIAEAQLDKHLAAFGITGSDAELVAARKNHEPPEPTHALVIDGDSLKIVLNDALKQKFLLLCKKCKAVLCCRVSPAQKAAVVRLVKYGLDVITLSIGDGANDVAMIQEADVGVGIAGEEGRAAVMSSDFAIGQFRFLARLTLVHGRWCYRRLAETIANFFYKNIVWTFSLFWYQIYDNYDCAYVFDYTYILLYNLAFTSLPVIFMGILDQDVSDKVSLAVPQLYRRGIERKEWTQLKFWIYMVDGLYQSVICFFMAYLLFAPGNFVTESGHNVNDNKRIGVYIANAAVVVVNTYILLNTYRWDWLMVLITLISVLLIFAWTGIYTSFTASFLFYKAGAEVYGQATFWAQTFLTVVICLLPRFAAKSYQKIYRPRDVDIVREQVRQGKFDYLKNEDPSNLAVADKASSRSSDSTGKGKTLDSPSRPEDERPIYPGSVAATTTNPHSPENSHDSWNAPTPQITEPTRPSYDRMRTSTDKWSPSFARSPDLTSAARLTRMESQNSAANRFSAYMEPDLEQLER